MRFLFYIVCFIFFTPFFAYTQTSINLDNAIEDSVNYLTGRFPRGTRVSVIAIQSENSELSELTLKKISGVLVNKGWFIAVERNAAALERLSREMNYQLSGEISDETSLSIGKQLGAEIIISGSIHRSNQNWQLDIQALRVESAQLAGQWSSGLIRTDPSWASLVSGRTTAISFAGDTLSSRDRQTVTNGLRDAMQSWKTSLELDENAQVQTSNRFTITIYTNKLPSDLLQAEILVSFFYNNRIIANTGPYYITEMTDALISRRVVERLKNDKAFFAKINESLR